VSGVVDAKKKTVAAPITYYGKPATIRSFEATCVVATCTDLAALAKFHTYEWCLSKEQREHLKTVVKDLMASIGGEASSSSQAPAVVEKPTKKAKAGSKKKAKTTAEDDNTSAIMSLFK